MNIIEGWFPFFARAEGDYEGIPPPAVAEVYARVSFAKRRANSGYCEEVRLENPIAQPVDSYSNVAFAITGLHMVAVGVLDRWRQRAARSVPLAMPLALLPEQFPVALAGGAHAALVNPYASLSQMEAFPVYSVVNGLVQFYCGLSSFLFHASMTALGQRLDMAGVYMLVVSPSLYMLLRLGAFGRPAALTSHAAFTAATAVCAYAFYQYKWQLERYTGGSTNLVLDLVAIMALLIVRPHCFSFSFSFFVFLSRTLLTSVVCRRRCGCGCWARRAAPPRKPMGTEGWAPRLRPRAPAAAAMSCRRATRSSASPTSAPHLQASRLAPAAAGTAATQRLRRRRSTTPGCRACCARSARAGRRAAATRRYAAQTAAATARRQPRPPPPPPPA